MTLSNQKHRINMNIFATDNETNTVVIAKSFQVLVLAQPIFNVLYCLH